MSGAAPPSVCRPRCVVKEALNEQFEKFLRRRALRDYAKADAPPDKATPSLDDTTALDSTVFARQLSDDQLPKGSPYVGFKRHAPPSPVLRFAATAEGRPIGDFSALGGEEPEPFTSLDCPGRAFSSLVGVNPEADQALEARVEKASPGYPAELPPDVWAFVLSLAVEVPSICGLARVSRQFSQVITSPAVWRGRRIRVGPEGLEYFAPVLDIWLNAWSSVEKLWLPNSGQLLQQVAARAPSLNVEVTWRFDAQFCAAGVEVAKRGAIVRRVADEELVVLGDAPLVASASSAPYLEVRLDRRLAAQVGGDTLLNDMGIGFTAATPKELKELGAVADEVPSSWVVDFAQSFVVLSVNNVEAARSWKISAASLSEGDTVGIRLQPGGAIEVYINSVLRESLLAAPQERVPMGVKLYPVFDLFGLTEQMSCTGACEPGQ